MGLLNKKLTSWADTCRRIAGCSKTDTAHQQPAPQEVNLGQVVAPRRTPKFPSRERNFAVRRRRRPDNNNGGSGASANYTSCQSCSNRRSRMLETEEHINE